MKQLHFDIRIKAPKDRVWQTLLEDASYREWTSVFSPGSYAVGDWTEGSRMQFLGTEGTGISSRIFRHVPAEFLSIQHLGLVAGGVEDFDSEETKKWAGALENYSVSERAGITELVVDIDVTDDYVAYFQEAWPKALEKIKNISEAGA